MKKFLKGMDISTLKELENLGVKYYDEGVEKDLLSILKDNDVNAIRLRLWNDPYSENGKPYGAGTNDLNTTLELAKRTLEKGFEFLLDLHYSDFWADPGKQFKPKAWKDYNNEQLTNAVYNYTREVLLKFREENAFPTIIQVGNELSNGLLWPNGKILRNGESSLNYDIVIEFVNAAIRGVRSVDSNIPIMIHLDNGGNNELYREWFDNFMQRGEEFQIIGLSYYPFWHKTPADLEKNMKDIAVRYHKDLIVAEVSMGYTMEDYAEYEQLIPSERKGMATKPELTADVTYPMSPEGQSGFMNEIMNILNGIPESRGKGFFYWEPAWLPVKGSGWATSESLEYIQDKGPCGNEWANQALFDYKGNSLPCLKVIRDFKYL